ncbi:MAG: hypothetical protein KKD64_17365 [Alphaproteobacteria bacterium]|nr:hypothetical protein [Alphaproteobacteria bacterium]MBU0794732.1 hypothetical protein [Alphaproteobacteria bacterium]MBU0875462.1 hypothetical protein [Alphaproteobacteria bacterium]MBU1771411.1 hypothetical protein [Alphaproteobacteria bacterium]
MQRTRAPSRHHRAESRPQRSHWRRRLAWCAALLFIAGLLGSLLLTESAPAADARPTPTPTQVGAGRDAIEQLRASRAAGGVSRLHLTPAHLDGLSALATHGFRPDRLDMYLHDERLYVTASHALPLGRWLNVDLVVNGSSAAFPETHARIGALSLPPFLTRMLFGVARQVLRVRGAVIPPLDELVQSFAIRNGAIMAAVQMPPKTGILDQFTGSGSGVDETHVLDLYCDLAALQARDPQADFAVHVRRAFPPNATATATPDTNRAAFVALAMLVVDPRAGQLAGLDQRATGQCARPTQRITLHGRDDLPKHWALSAALAAQTGVQLSSAMGEWKELADSLSATSVFQTGAGSGFSFVDLAADRSGSQLAQAATQPDRAREAAQRLSTATQEGLLPPALLGNDEGLTDDAFAALYGSVDDPRYARLVSEIDRDIAQEGLLALPN